MSNAIEKTRPPAATFSRLMLKRFLNCLPPAAKTRVLLLEAESVTCFVRESRRLWRCGDISWISFFIPFPYNRLNPSVCKFLRGERSSKSESRGQTASVRDTERTLAIMLRRAERAIRMFHNRAGAASLYEHWLHRLDGHQSATSNDSRDPAKRNDDGLIPFRNFSAT